MIRKRPGDRDPNGASGQGRTDGAGENFTRKNRSSPWNVQSVHPERSYSRLDNDNGGDQWQEPKSSENVLRNKEPFGFTAGSRDIWADTCENGNMQGAGVITAGVNRSQADGKKIDRND